jgi:hypothetical protein
MQINSPAEAPDYHKIVFDYRDGNRVSKILLTGKEGKPDNYKLGLSSGGSSENWTTPRHRHTFEQIRIPLVGDYAIKKDEVLPTGWVAYFPESVYYGPQVKSGNLTMLALQFGGPSGHGYLSAQQRKKATDEMRADGKGTFADGIYTWTDEAGQRHNRDASEASEAKARGHDIDYPEPRYNDIIMVNPNSFSWADDAALPGVSRKNLGTFTERDVRVAFVRMDKGAALPFGTENSPEVLFLREGAVTHDNHRYEQHTAFGTEVQESPTTLTAVEPSELVYMKLPTF